MLLNPQQNESIVELINIAFGRAAASFSELTGQRVHLNLPKVNLYTMEELQKAFNEAIQGEVATVHQIFSGSVSGSALLMFDYNGALALSRLLMEGAQPAERLNETDREALMEVGNILLNACLGTFGNILHVHISFSVPRMNISSLNSLLESLLIGSEELQYALVALTEFSLKDSAVGGYLVLVLGVSSLERLIEAIEKMT